MIASAQVETTLLVLKLAFLVLLYVFIWRIVRSASRDLRLPQESMILRPHQAAGLLHQPAAPKLGRLVVTADGQYDLTRPCRIGVSSIAGCRQAEFALPAHLTEEIFAFVENGEDRGMAE